MTLCNFYKTINLPQRFVSQFETQKLNNLTINNNNNNQINLQLQPVFSQSHLLSQSCITMVTF